MVLLILVSIAIIYSAIILPGIIDFICSRNISKENFRGVYIPSSAGISFVLYITFACGFMMIYSSVLVDPINFIIDILSVLAGIFSAALTGYIDDITGDNNKGIKGHGAALLKMRFTSGSIKALVGIMIAFTISLSWKQSIVHIILNGLIICLMQNFINLMDLRPGRAVKAYTILIFISLLSGSIRQVFSSVGISLLVMLIFYSSYELKEICMMGDSGSNTLGIMMGMIAASSENIIYKYIVLSLLIITQAYSEKRSINNLIERVGVLRFIDMIGRRK